MDATMESPWASIVVPQRSVLAAQIYEILKSRRMDNVGEPGSRLSIDGLARDLRVSPTPIREALARLESDGLVTKRAHYGYAAAPLMDATHLEELFKMRLLLEPACAGWAAQAASPRQITGMEDLIAEMARPVRGEGYESYKL